MIDLDELRRQHTTSEKKAENRLTTLPLGRVQFHGMYELNRLHCEVEALLKLCKTMITEEEFLPVKKSFLTYNHPI